MNCAWPSVMPANDPPNEGASGEDELEDGAPDAGADAARGEFAVDEAAGAAGTAPFTRPGAWGCDGVGSLRRWGATRLAATPGVALALAREARAPPAVFARPFAASAFAV